jgi:nickel transport protein
MKRLLTLVFLAVLLSSPALAHNLKIFAAAAAGGVSGKVYFVGGGAAQNVPVALKGADGQTLATVTTAADGSFTFATLPAGTVAVTVAGGDGHMATFPLSAAAGGAEAKPAAATPAGCDGALSQQLLPLAERLDALESSLRLRDVLGGLGYIFGLFGLWAWMKARGRTP